MNLSTSISAGSSPGDQGLSPVRVDSPLVDPLHPLHAEGMDLIDGCPECVLSTERPTVAVPVEAGWRCGYRCSDCGHRWATSWKD